MADSLKIKPELYYAYSLLGNKNISKNEREINFANLNKGFYDDLVNKDSEIKANKDLLKQVKSKGIKESIYSNKPIPNTWKNKLGYYGQLYETMSEDKNFISYLGRTSKDLVPKQKEDKPLIEPLSKTEIAAHPIESFTSVGFNTSKLKITKSSLITPNQQTSSSLSKPRKLFSSNLLGTIEENPKQISNILEEYKTAYPIQLKSEDKSHFPKLAPMNQTEGLSCSSHFPSAINKKEVFKSTIYSNLIPDQANPLKQGIAFPIEKKKKAVIKKSTYGPFLNFDYESYYKNIEITNPKIKKKLTELDYYGPYYSHCPSCRNKNLEFYETMEPTQCMKLLTQLKKTRCDVGYKYHH